MNLILLAGMPATGKSTVAAALSETFGYPILEKDYIKEGLFDTLGFENYAQKRALDHAANNVLLRMLEAILKAGKSVIVDNNFDTLSGEKLCQLIENYHPDCVTVFLSGDAKVLHQRYTLRDNSHKRHLGHVLQDHYPPREGDSLYYTMTPEEFDEKFFKRGMAAFRCPGLRLDVDMTNFSTVSIPGLVQQVRELLEKKDEE